MILQVAKRIANIRTCQTPDYRLYPLGGLVKKFTACYNLSLSEAEKLIK